MADLFDSIPTMANEVRSTAELAIAIKADYQAFERYGQATLESMQRMGELLHEVKKSLQHGLFVEWIKKHCPFSTASANRYMAAHRDRGKNLTMRFLDDILEQTFKTVGEEEDAEGNSGQSSQDPGGTAGGDRGGTPGGSENSSGKPTGGSVGTQGKTGAKGTRRGMAGSGETAEPAAAPTINDCNKRIGRGLEDLSGGAASFALILTAREVQPAIVAGWKRMIGACMEQIIGQYRLLRKAGAKEGEKIADVRLDPERVIRAAAVQLRGLLDSHVKTDHGRRLTVIAEDDAWLKRLEEALEVEG